MVDYRRSLLDSVTTDHLIGYAPSPAVAQNTVAELTEAMRLRLPGPDVTPAQLRERSWWTGADLYLLVDDYDLVATRDSNPLAPMLDILPHSRDIGLHLIIARASGGAARGMFEPVLQRVREYGAPGLLLSGSPDEGYLLGEVAPRRQIPGRGLLVGRRGGTRLVQTAYYPPP